MKVNKLRIALIIMLSLTAVCLISLIVISFQNTRGINDSGELAPMVFVESKLYIIDESAKNPDAILITDNDYIGSITNVVNSSQIPSEEFQANDQIDGAKVYRYGNNLLVKYDDKQWVYKPYK